MCLEQSGSLASFPLPGPCQVSSSKATPATAALEQKNRISLVSAPFMPFSLLFFFVFNPSMISLTLKWIMYLDTLCFDQEVHQCPAATFTGKTQFNLPVGHLHLPSYLSSQFTQVNAGFNNTILHQASFSETHLFPKWWRSLVCISNTS